MLLPRLRVCGEGNHSIDWDRLCISQIPEEISSAFSIIEEDDIYELLGLRDNDAGTSVVEESSPVHDQTNIVHDQTTGAGLVDEEDFADQDFQVVDDIPIETMVQYDKDDPPMEKGSRFATMEEFRTALNTHAIKYQFDVKTEKTEAIRLGVIALVMGVHGL